MTSRPGRPHRPYARLATGLAGGVSVAAGAVVAWRANAPTALLVVGAVLIALAWLGDRVESVVFRRDGTEAQLTLSGIAGRAEEAINKAIEATDPAEVLEQLELAKGQLRSLHRLTERLANSKEPRRQLRAQLVWSLGTVWAVLEPDEYMLNGSLVCRYRRPNGSADSFTTTGPAELGSLVHLPLDIPGGPGKYEVTWAWSYTSDGGGSRQVAAVTAVVPDNATEGWASDWM